jgi:aspartyl-tRNA(Asn)/glutamyl-tRNA(Gln) amidotransferase subunit B
MKEVYEPTIGLEIHVELKTNTKMFCDSLNDPNEKHPNLNVCPVCMGHPGTLPTINQEAINKLISVGLALNCQIAEFSKFDRKNYFYPDLPKGYQISQYDMPLCTDGWLEIKSGDTTKKINLERIHMEEDTGRLMHPENADYSLVDYNRAGIPLMELVTKPDLKSGEDIENFAKELQLILRYLGASDADMEKGQMRVEVNISVNKKGAKELGTKVEVKNINSIRNASMAADYEFTRQSEALANGKEIRQETRGWDDTNQTTISQRKKEGSADYRYFPEPDLPPMKFSKNQVEEMRLALPELPAARRERLKKEYKLNDSQIEIFTLARHFGNYFEQITSELNSWDNFKHLEKPAAEHQQKLYNLAANYLITEFPPLFNMKGLEIDELEGIKITPAAFGELVVRIFHNEVSSTGAKMVLKEMFETGLTPGEIIANKNLGQVSDTGELGGFVDEVIAKNTKAVEDYKNGKLESIKFLTGQVMALSRGKANPQVVSQLLEQKLK